jgi:hypothetical protein
VPAPLVTALSPYHLATREPAAMAALVLSTRAVTLMPHPTAGTSREAVELAVRRAPRYLRLMEAWRWSVPLWRLGVISTAADGEQACQGVSGVYDDIRNDASLAELRPLTRSADELCDERPDAFLDATCADLLRGGPDPGINIPLNAALERFSERHGLVSVRGAASSIAQRAESRLGAKVFSFGVPMLVQAGAARILLLRNDLEKPLRALRRAILRSFDAGAADPSLAAAAAEYGEAFRSWAERGFGRGDDDTGIRVMTSFISVTGMSMPTDAVLRSSRAAVRSVGVYVAAGRVRRGADPAGAPPETAAAAQRTLVIREMNVSPAV